MTRPSSLSFVTVTDEPWTLTGNIGNVDGNKESSLCLKPTKAAESTGNKRIFCLFNGQDQIRDKWSNILRIEKGCKTKISIRADLCGDIKLPNGMKKFKLYCLFCLKYKFSQIQVSYLKTFFIIFCFLLIFRWRLSFTIRIFLYNINFFVVIPNNCL